ncbi:MAG: hypothetical protein Q7T57_02295, partial [Dehalococcoidales bacterium]|nr:hypothetical protein [Dehalococcoidales bacterium]
SSVGVSSRGESAASIAAAANQSTATAHALQARADQSLLVGYSEIAARITRKRKLDDAVSKLQMERNLAGKGARVKIKPRNEEEDQFGEVEQKKMVYKWKLDRKR